MIIADRRNAEYTSESFPNVTFSNTNSIWAIVGLNKGCRGEKLVTDKRRTHISKWNDHYILLIPGFEGKLTGSLRRTGYCNTVKIEINLKYI